MNKEIIGHRGAPRLARENTIGSFQKALELNVDWLEIDVRKTRDGILIAFHDQAIEGKNISELSLKELNQIAQAQDFIVPSLEECLRLGAGKIKFQIELKERGYEPEAVELALKYLKPENFSIISFNFESLLKVKEKYPKIATCLIIGLWYGRVTQALFFALRRNKILPFVNGFCINWKLWISGFANLIPEGYPITVWTANETRLINSLLGDKKVFAITSDLPDLALKLRQKYEQHK